MQEYTSSYLKNNAAGTLVADIDVEEHARTRHAAREERHKRHTRQH
jgi:hypothetical protein